jgi:ribosome maturation factor RimP
MYSFRVYPKDGRIIVRMDKPSDKCACLRRQCCVTNRPSSDALLLCRFGSPSLDELSDFTLALDNALCACPSTPDEVTVEVSSAGAERQVRVPQDLGRFQDLPMRVSYDPAAAVVSPEPKGKDKAKEAGPLQQQLAGGMVEEIFDLVAIDEAKGTTTWRTADVRANRTHLKKGQPLGKKVKDRRVELPLGSLHKVHLHIDV